jgi:hypothetical protein
MMMDFWVFVSKVSYKYIRDIGQENVVVKFKYTLYHESKVDGYEKGHVPSHLYCLFGVCHQAGDTS